MGISDIIWGYGDMRYQKNRGVTAYPEIIGEVFG